MVIVSVYFVKSPYIPKCIYSMSKIQVEVISPILKSVIEDLIVY